MEKIGEINAGAETYTYYVKPQSRCGYCGKDAWYGWNLKERSFDKELDPRDGICMSCDLNPNGPAGEWIVDCPEENDRIKSDIAKMLKEYLTKHPELALEN